MRRARLQELFTGELKPSIPLQSLPHNMIRLQDTRLLTRIKSIRILIPFLCPSEAGGFPAPTWPDETGGNK